MSVTSLYGLYLAVRSMVSFSKMLTLWSLCLVPVVAIGVALSGRLVFRTQDRLQQSKSDATEYLLERVKNLRLVRTSNMQQQEYAEGQGKFQSVYRSTISAMLSDNLMASFIAITPVALIVITFVVGSIYVAKGQLSLGEVVGFYSVSSLASIRISALITVYGDLSMANGIFDKISRVLKAEEVKCGGLPMDIPDASIGVENVSFSYGDKQVLKDLTCRIPQGKVTAIIGENGAGKTTLFKLLEQMYEPDAGQICFGERNVADIDPIAWRGAFALVSQDRPLLSGTIRENITYGCTRKVTDGELENLQLEGIRTLSAYRSHMEQKIKGEYASSLCQKLLNRLLSGAEMDQPAQEDVLAVIDCEYAPLRIRFSLDGMTPEAWAESFGNESLKAFYSQIYTDVANLFGTTGKESYYESRKEAAADMIRTCLVLRSILDDQRNATDPTQTLHARETLMRSMQDRLINMIYGGE